MVTLTKQQVLARINDVVAMNEQELNEFGIKVSLSEIDDKAKYFIYQAIDYRKEQLQNNIDIFVVNGDIDDMDFN